MSLVAVFLYSLLTAVATGLGALPFFWVRQISPRMVGFCNALAAGLMLGASLELLIQGAHVSLLRTGLGALIGLLFIIGMEKVLQGREEFDPTTLMGANLRKMFLIVAIMTVHSFAEGVSMGFAFGKTELFGILIALALAVHNIPEGLAISAVLVPKGASPWRAAGWSVFSSLPQPIMAVPAFLFVSAFHGFLAGGLGFAAGAMLWLVFAELVPEARQSLPVKAWLPAVSLSALAMLSLGFWLPA